jgi:hypothetical protein
MNSFKDQYFKIEDFLTLVRNKQERSEDYDPDFVYAVYSEQDIFESGITVYIGAPADIDGDDDDIFRMLYTKMVCCICVLMKIFRM